MFKPAAFSYLVDNSHQRTFHDIAAKIGLQFDQMPYMADWVQNAGFRDVMITEKLIPIGRWPKNKRLKEIGQYYQVHMLEGGTYTN